MASNGCSIGARSECASAKLRLHRSASGRGYRLFVGRQRRGGHPRRNPYGRDLRDEVPRRHAQSVWAKVGSLGGAQGLAIGDWRLDADKPVDSQK